MSTPERGEFFQSVQGLALALAVIALLAFVLPSILATRLQQRRLARAEAQVRDVASRLHVAGLSAALATFDGQDIAVLTGPGDSIVESSDRRWIASRQAPLQSYFSLPADGLSPDPWLRALQVNVGASRHGGRVWVLSAGPNGIIDTPFEQSEAAGPSGDDVAAAVP